MGETILHMCFLNATRVHYDLAKFIIKKYTCLVNDIYLSDEFYGKSNECRQLPKVVSFLKAGDLVREILCHWSLFQNFLCCIFHCI